MALKNQEGHYLKIEVTGLDACTGNCMYTLKLFETEQQRIDGLSEFQQAQPIGGTCNIDVQANNNKTLYDEILTQVYSYLKTDGSYSGWIDC